MKLNFFIIVSLIFLSMSSCGKKEEEAIKIGAILSLSGDGAPFGKSSKNGIELALKINSIKNVLNGEKIEIKYEDDMSKSEMAVSTFNKLTTLTKIPVIIGPMSSSAVLAVAPLANRKKIIILSPVASSPLITEAGEYIFRNVASDIIEGKIMADYAYSNLKYKNISILSVNNDYGRGLQQVFRTRFEELGGKIISEGTFPQTETNFRTQLIKIKKLKPDAVYLVGYREMGLVLKQARELKLDKQFLSTVLFENPEILEIAGQASEKVIFSSRAYDANSGDSIVNHFVRSYSNEYGEKPDIFAALSYDAFNIIIKAISIGGYSSAGIKKSLYEIKNYLGVTGIISFDENGDVIQPASIKMVINGNFVTIR